MKQTSIQTALHKRQGAFTLLEIMIVVVIIGLLAGAAVVSMGGNVGAAQNARVRGDCQAMSTALKLYQAMNGFLPTTAQGIEALVTRPTSDPRPSQWNQGIEKLPLDPWSNKYIYAAPGKGGGAGSFDLYSAGPDRTPGTEDDVRPE